MAVNYIIILSNGTIINKLSVAPNFSFIKTDSFIAYMLQFYIHHILKNPVYLSCVITDDTYSINHKTITFLEHITKKIKVLLIYNKNVCIKIYNQLSETKLKRSIIGNNNVIMIYKNNQCDQIIHWIYDDEN